MLETEITLELRTLKQAIGKKIGNTNVFAFKFIGEDIAFMSGESGVGNKRHAMSKTEIARSVADFFSVETGAFSWVEEAGTRRKIGARIKFKCEKIPDLSKHLPDTLSGSL